MDLKRMRNMWIAVIVMNVLSFMILMFVRQGYWSLILINMMFVVYGAMMLYQTNTKIKGMK